MHAIRIKPGSKVNLGSIKPSQTDGLDEKAGREIYTKQAAELGELCDLMSAAATHSVLVIVQGMDTAGKDGAIRDVFARVNPAHSRAEAFKVPSTTELAHDFLWRVHQKTPELGQLSMFNRSQYEDVLVVRVHKLVPKSVWRGRYELINAFERNLSMNNTIIVKFFLHISEAEQQERLLDREEDPLKSWKLATGDWLERQHWSEYQKAYEDVLDKCSTDVAPWYVVPADHKWFRNVAMTETMIDVLKPYTKGWRAHLNEQSKMRLAELAEARDQGLVPRNPRKTSKK